MSKNSSLRAAIRISLCATSLAVPFLCSGAADATAKVQAQLIEQAEFPCANCLFGKSSTYYCFAAGSEVLVGRQKVPVLNYKDKSKNYLNWMHRGWAAWTPPGATLPITYDDKHIWVSRAEAAPARRSFLRSIGNWFSRANDKQAKLTRSSERNVFSKEDRCRDTDRPKAH